MLLSSDNGPVVDDRYQDEAVEKLGNHKAGVSSALVCRSARSIPPPVSPHCLASQLQPSPWTAKISNLSFWGRTQLVEQGEPISLRIGNWKFIPASPGTAKNKNTNIETGNAPDSQLYDLSQDIGESQNLAKTQQNRVKAMASELEKARLEPGK